jgi:signal transduction histidine kinase
MMVQSRQAAMGEMLGNIAHQWRQPLNIMGLIIQDIHDAQAHGQLTPDYLEKSVRRGMDVIQHMSQTIDDFRGFYRRDKEQQTFILNEVVDRALSFIEEGFHNNHIAIDVKMPEAVAATGYPNEFAQVLLNILNNARDVLLERRVRSPKLAIRVFSDQGRSVVTIADNAGGIMAEDLDRVFDPFFTTKEEGQGTGIGLYMSKIIIEQNMSGRLTARNIAEGAEFRIEV